jgi:hypothetical protein
MLHCVEDGKCIEAFRFEFNAMRDHVSVDDRYAEFAMNAIEDVLCNGLLPSVPKVIHERDIESERRATWGKEP